MWFSRFTLDYLETESDWMINNDPSNFLNRHVGIDESAVTQMLSIIGADSVDSLISETIPQSIRKHDNLKIPAAMSEYDYLNYIKAIGEKNVLAKSYIGQGYYGTITPSVILRNIFQNPGWYTQYTPYQAEISQGRMEALMNFQTVVSDLTGLPIANASLLDEGTAAAEAMTMFYGIRNKRVKGEPVRKVFVDRKLFQQTKDVLALRAEPLDIQIIEGDWKSVDIDDTYFAACIQYPDADGIVNDYSDFKQKCEAQNVYLIAAADLLSLVLYTPPGEWGADACVGTTQRFGVPIGFGGPHAAFFATKEDFKRQIPGRIIGLSIDSEGKQAYRMALQTREQHIKREKATSNICTAQALLAVMAGMYAVYHGAEGLHYIATRIHAHASLLRDKLSLLGFVVKEGELFDTITVELTENEKNILQNSGINVFNQINGQVSISLDETCGESEVNDIVNRFSSLPSANKVDTNNKVTYKDISPEFERKSSFLQHATFKKYRSETEMMRYIKRLENKDLSLMHSMIPLGSCTMKLNAATELFPVSFPEFANLHPFCPIEQSKGYQQIFEELENYLAEITGFDACSLQPNSGAQGEYAGLMVIREYHKSRGDAHRNIAIIPSSAHGTNPASAIMAGMKVVVVKCDDLGNIDLQDLKEKAELHKESLAALMVTYPSTHGVFEEDIREICRVIHDFGGKVYMDGANMNAQVGLTSPGLIGADVCHLNLHKTFAIPHGGGGPGMGPICVNESLAPFLPGHFVTKGDDSSAINSVSAAPYGSASILLISYAYIRLLGYDGLKRSTELAILNANYIKDRLKHEYDVLYLGKNNRAAHELILDLRTYKSIGISAEDVAKRLIDYGFHAPTLSFPVAGTIMIEPTESESLDELDRFCEAMLLIKLEIDEVARGEMSADSNTLTNAPHTLTLACGSEWPYAYSREKAVFPMKYQQEVFKFWPSVSRVDNAHGDRNLICTCPPIEEYA